MTTRELARYIGRNGQLFVENGSISCPIESIDSRQCWDRIDVLVQVVGGTGSKWVDVNRVEFEEGE